MKQQGHTFTNKQMQDAKDVATYQMTMVSNQTNVRIKIAMALLAVVADLTKHVALVNTQAFGNAMNVTNIY